MPVSFDDLIPTHAGAKPPSGPLSFDDLIPAEQEKPKLGFWGGLAESAEALPPGVAKGVAKGALGLVDAVRGGETEHPDAPEFLPAYTKATGGKLDDAFTAINQSAITPDPQAQLDILRKRIPGLEAKADAHGNVMLKAPGMSEWSYLNKPGLSGRDVDEFGTQTLATLPFLGVVGKGASTLGRMGTGAAGLGGASVEQDVLAGAAGSEQGIDPLRAGVSASFGAVTAPGVPSAIASGTARVADAVTAPVRNLARGVANPDGQAAGNVASAFARDATGDVVPSVTGQQLENLGRSRLATAAPEQDARLMDIGGERTRGLARSAANTSPEARGVLMGVIQPRFETQNARAVETIRQIAGSRGDATGAQAGLEAAQGAINPQLYSQAYADGAAGIMTPEIGRLTAAPDFAAAMDAAANSFANRVSVGRVQTSMTSPTGQPTLEFWDQVARSLSDREGALRVGGQLDAAATVGEMRRTLQDALDAAVPAFRTARGTAAAFFGASDALDAGRRVALGQFGAADARDTVGQRLATGKWTPAQIEQARGRMSNAEHALFREGYVSSWIDKLNATGDNRNVIALLNGSPKVRQEMEAVLGPNRARQLEAFMLAERMIDRIRGAVSGNSTTTRQLMELGLATGAGAFAGGFDPSNPIGWIAAFLTHRGARHIGSVADQRVALATARMLISRDPAVFNQGLTRVAHSPMLRSLRDADLAFSGIPRAAAAKMLTPETQGQPAVEQSEGR